jgi:hypothetical protein
MYTVKITLLTLLLLTGCAQHQIVNRANPSANWNADLYQCSQEAANAFPVLLSSTTQVDPTATAMRNYSNSMSRLNAQQALSSTNCISFAPNSINCTSTGTTAAPVAVQQSPVYRTTTSDANAANRQQHTARCLASKGWQREMIQR